MLILNVSQERETETWLNARRGRVTGTKSTGMALEPYAQIDIEHLRDMADKTEDMAARARTAGKAAEYHAKAEEYRSKIAPAVQQNKRLKTTVAFWEFLAETVAEEASGENPAERGHRLENENAATTVQKFHLPNPCFDTGLWVSEEDDRLAVSPDCHEDSDAPTWAVECKSLGTANHLAAVVPWLIHQKLVSGDAMNFATLEKLREAAWRVCPERTVDLDARPFDFIPDKFHGQALQYFVVNPHLETLFFSFFDDRVFLEDLRHVVIPVHRETIAEDISAHKVRQLDALHIVDHITETMGWHCDF